MAMHFRCPCGDTVIAPDGSAGKKGECSSCGKILVVPAEAIVTGATMPGRRAPAPSFDEEPAGLKAPPVIEVEEVPSFIEIEEVAAPVVTEELQPAALMPGVPPVMMEEAPPLMEEEVSPFADLQQELAQVALPEEPLAAFPPAEPPAPLPLVEELPAIEDIPDLVTIEPGAPTEEVTAPPPPARRPPARKPSRRKARGPEEPTRMQAKPTRPARASKRERPAKPSRAQRPSKRSARRPSKRRGALCRNCGMELRPGETMCSECGAKVGGSSVGIYVLVMIIIVILVAIAVVATAATGVLPQPVDGHVRRAIEMVGLGVYFQRFSSMVRGTDTPPAKEEAPAPPEAE